MTLKQDVNIIMRKMTGLQLNFTAAVNIFPALTVTKHTAVAIEKSGHASILINGRFFAAVAIMN
ncbi:hypothetical protein [Lentibacillus persicus]|uniref:hypothetical protein n=1 Tax=Lentibacillus persicus TaxID=640948 RepID=UPI003182FB12